MVLFLFLNHLLTYPPCQVDYFVAMNLSSSLRLKRYDRPIFLNGTESESIHSFKVLFEIPRYLAAVPLFMYIGHLSLFLFKSLTDSLAALVMAIFIAFVNSDDSFNSACTMFTSFQLLSTIGNFQTKKIC